jgi:hypothetical protein
MCAVTVTACKRFLCRQTADAQQQKEGILEHVKLAVASILAAA